MAAEATITISVRPTLAIALIRAVRVLAPLLGPERAMSVAQKWAPRLMLVRVGRGRWHFLKEG